MFENFKWTKIRVVLVIYKTLFWNKIKQGGISIRLLLVIY